MANVIAIIQDDRVRRQVEQYLQQLNIENLRFATFTNHQEFTALYFRERKAPDPQATEAALEAKIDGADETEMKLFSEVHLLIYALDSIGEKSNTWLDKVKFNFKKFKYWPQAAPLRSVLLKYEDDGIGKLDVLHPLLDDLIYLPLDRLVFLQKIEILLNLPKVIKPSFLFNQEIKAPIEISKITKLDRLSDVGLAIRNPVPLKKGLPGHFYVQLPGEKNRIEIRGKVFRSEPHPDIPGQYLIYFAYFGLTKLDLSSIRRNLSKAPRYQSLYNDNRSVFRHKTDNIFAETTDTKNFGVAVIDPDIINSGALAAQLNKDMDRLNVMVESSYSYFLHKYFEMNGKTDQQPPKATEATDFFSPKLNLSIAVADLKCLGVDPGPNPGDLFLGHSATDIFASPEKWLSLITDKGSRLVLEEAAVLAQKGRSTEKIIVLQDIGESPRAVNCTVQPGSADNLASLTLTPASLSDIVTKMSSAQQNKDLEIIIMDTAYVPEDPVAWIEGLRNRAVQVGLVKDPRCLNFSNCRNGYKGRRTLVRYARYTRFIY